MPDPKAGAKRVSWITWSIVAVVALAIAATVWLTTGSSGPAYRLTTVTSGSPVQTLDSVGTLTPENQANLNFSTSGTVASVGVTVGQAVTAGQTLASLDTTSLQASVLSAQATVTSAQAKLTDDENGETSSSNATNASATDTAASAGATTAILTADITDASTGETPNPGGGSQSSGGGDSAIAQAQSTLLADQKESDADQQQAAADLQQAISACAAVTASPTPTTTTTTTAATSADTPPTAPTSTPGPSITAACTQALQQVASDQSAVSQAQTTVGSDESALAAALTSAASSSGGSASPTTSTPSSGSGGSGGSGNGSAGSGGSANGGSGTSASGNFGGGNSSPSSGGSSAASSVATPQQLASDQAALDVANAGLTSAQQDLADANLLSPIAGTVASVSVASGAAVTAGSNIGPSAGAAIVVIGPGSFVVTTDIGVTDIGDVLVGQKATITPDATTKTITGTVTSIGLVPSASSSSTSYPVTLSVDNNNGLQLTSGADAGVSIVTKGSTGVPSVPSSAVQTIGSTHFVTEYNNGTTSRVRVTLGTVGDVLTQITSGVKPGATVVLADLNAPIPASSATTTGRGGALGGGLGGAGLGGTGRIGGGLTGGGAFTGRGG
ncbi:MAG TPA: HlyD family efflux transporter periplasmic adaptor subunit [Acidimicrobiales bacterium]